MKAKSTSETRIQISNTPKNRIQINSLLNVFGARLLELNERGIVFRGPDDKPGVLLTSTAEFILPLLQELEAKRYGKVSAARTIHNTTR